MRIAVLIKQVPDTWGERRMDVPTGRLDRAASDRIIDESCERALEAALSLKDADRDTEVVVVSMGPDEAAESLRKALSMGADSAVHIVDDALEGSDMLRTGLVLAGALRGGGYDLIVAGNESTDGRGGMVPAIVAQELGLPSLLNLDALELAGGGVRGTQARDDGTAQLSASLPAVVSVTERMPEARFPNFKGIMTAKRKPLETVAVADVGVDLASLPASTVLSTVERPARTAGRIVTDDGTAASELVAFLAERRLI